MVVICKTFKILETHTQLKFRILEILFPLIFDPRVSILDPRQLRNA